MIREISVCVWQEGQTGGKADGRNLTQLPRQKVDLIKVI